MERRMIRGGSFGGVGGGRTSNEGPVCRQVAHTLGESAAMTQA